jgi:hypothetical protein
MEARGTRGRLVEKIYGSSSPLRKRARNCLSSTTTLISGSHIIKRRGEKHWSSMKRLEMNESGK